MTDARLVDYISHILEAAKLACVYVEGIDRDAFNADTRTQQAVVMNIIVMGEAATKLASESPEFVDAHPEIPWKSMRGMRNRIAHGYFEIDFAVVWDTVQIALPQLIEKLAPIHRELKK